MTDPRQLNARASKPLDDDDVADALLGAPPAPATAPDEDSFALLVNAAAEPFRRRLDAEAWPRGLPWERRVRSGQLDFWRTHCFALDRLDELLGALLPSGGKGFTAKGIYAWTGWHPDRPIAVSVCLLTGRWDEPETGKGGGDLVSLAAHLFGVSQLDGARILAEWCEIDGCRYA